MDLDKEAKVAALTIRLNQCLDQSVTLQDEALLEEAKLILEEMNLVLAE
jgi:hypothetical protein